MSAKDTMVVQSPLSMAIGEYSPITFDFGEGTAISGVISLQAYREDGTDVTAEVFDADGSNVISGSEVITRTFKPLEAGEHLLVLFVTIGVTAQVSTMKVSVFDPQPASGVELGANSYSSLEAVAARVPRHANKSKTFDDTTNPTRSEVIGFINQVSGILNIQLRTAGFTVPVTQADCRLALDAFVAQEVASMVEAVNGAGRFGPLTTEDGRVVRKAPLAFILKDTKDFIQASAPGFELLGAGRANVASAGIAYREADDRGNPTEPLFQRSGFGFKEIDWDR